MDIQLVGRQSGQRAAYEQQRISGQKRRYDQAGLAENDREQDRVYPYAVLGDHLHQMHVDVQHKIDQKMNIFHKSSSYRKIWKCNFRQLLLKNS